MTARVARVSRLETWRRCGDGIERLGFGHQRDEDRNENARADGGIVAPRVVGIALDDDVTGASENDLALFEHAHQLAADEKVVVNRHGAMPHRFASGLAGCI